MKRYLILIVVLLGGCAVVPYDGYNAQYGSPYAADPYYGVYPAPAYVAPAPVYFGSSVYFGGGNRHGHRGWYGHRH